MDAHRAFAQPIIHLEGLSDQKTFKVTIDWTTADIRKENRFNVTFYDPDTGRLVEDVKYDFIMYDAAGHSLVTRLGVHDPAQEFSFLSAGSYTLDIANIEDLGEGISVPIQVTPEFPANSTVLAPALILGPVSVRLATIYLERLFPMK